MYWDNATVMAEFTEILKNDPGKAYDFISCNACRFTKDGLKDIVKELLYSLHYHVDNRFYGDLYATILTDVQIELDYQYEEEYREVKNNEVQ